MFNFGRKNKKKELSCSNNRQSNAGSNFKFERLKRAQVLYPGWEIQCRGIICKCLILRNLHEIFFIVAEIAYSVLNQKGHNLLLLYSVYVFQSLVNSDEDVGNEYVPLIPRTSLLCLK